MTAEIAEDMPLQFVVSNLRGVIVGPVSLTVEAGTCAAVSGPSGSGKSLSLRMMADLEPSTGEVRLGELRREAVAAPAWRREVMYVAAEAGWWAETAAAHVPPQMHEAAQTLASRLGLGAADLERPIRLLSTGERQRFALVRALVRRPKVLLLDEPTGALDPASIARVEALLLEQTDAGMILVIVSHDHAQAERLGAVPYVMSSGRLAPA